MFRTLRLPLLALAAALAAPVSAQTDGFLVTNAAGDTLFYAAPDGTVLYGPEDARVQVTSGGEGLTSTVTRADGHPSAGMFSIENEANSAVALLGVTNGAGAATSGWALGQGSAGGFYNYDGSNPKPALEAFTLGSGAALLARQLGGDPTANVAEFWSGSGTDESTWEVAARVAADGRYYGTGANYEHALGSVHIGEPWVGVASIITNTTQWESAGYFANQSTESFAPTVQVESVGTGNALFIDKRGSNDGIEIQQRGDGLGMYIHHTGPSGEGIRLRHDVGSGSAAAFESFNPANGDPGVRVQYLGTGRAVHSVHTGAGGSAVEGWHNGAEGFSGRFSTGDFSNPTAALQGATRGTGPAFEAAQISGDATHDVAVFYTGDGFDPSTWNPVMRVAGDGNVYADGAFHGGGADFAERFEVVGGPAAYEVGDVLAISPSADRHLERASTPYSTAVLGVYATRPGVLLGDPSIDEASTVPVGVVGVVPTKVTGEGGPIRRGDLLVTSSTVGHAMRGEPGRVGVGMVIGKALQDFDGERGVIEVMVNVQ